MDWVYVGSLGGEYIENFAAAALRQKYPDALQTKPAQGDGGVDIYRETAEGLVVWQIKKYTTPLTSQQKSNVKASWVRFWKSRVARGIKIAKYHLATPWTPTDEARVWLRTLTQEAPFPVQWDGESFFNGLAADFPATADRFFKGADMLESMVNAKAILASLPVEKAAATDMLSAVAKREAELRVIRDLASDNYYIDSGTRTYLTDAVPMPDANEKGIYHRYTSLGDNRFLVESVVPKSAQSTEIDPITLEVRFEIEKGSDAERKVEDWVNWGAPFQDVPGRTIQSGGPLKAEENELGLLSFVQPPTDQSFPQLDVRIIDDDGLDRDVIQLQVREVTKGLSGGGMRIVAESPHKVFEMEMRSRSEQAADEFDLRIAEIEGSSPDLVLRDLSAILTIRPESEFGIYLSQGPEIMHGKGLRPGSVFELLHQLTADLTELQESCDTRIALPAMSELMLPQISRVHDLAEIYRGNPKVARWERMQAIVEDPDKWREALSQSGNLVHLDLSPILWLGKSEYRFIRAIAETAHSVTLAAGFDLESLERGVEIELVPAEDDRVTTALVVMDGPLPKHLTDSATEALQKTVD